MGIFARHNDEWYRVDGEHGGPIGGGAPGAAVIKNATMGLDASNNPLPLVPDTTSVPGFAIYEFTASGEIVVEDDGAGMVEALVVGGGGAGAPGGYGGAGAGGHLYLTDAYLPSGSLTVTVGAGGTTEHNGNNGIASRLGSYFSPGGAGGGRSGGPGVNGGSGGGAAGNGNAGGAGIPSLGNNGGNSQWSSGAGGGGAGSVGANNTSSQAAGNGGSGLPNSITGSPVTRAGGGGGGSQGGSAGTGGSGGGGNGSPSKNTTAQDGEANTGGGGGGAGYSGGAYGEGGSGGSGIVIVKVAI